MEKYLYWFYLLGLSSYNPHDTAPAKGLALFRRSIPAMCFMFVTSLNGVFSFNRFGQKKISLNECLHGVFSLLMIFTAVMAFKRASFLRGDTNYTWKYFVNLETLILNRLKLEINFERFASNYNQKLIYSTFLFICLLAFKIFHRITVMNAVRQIGALNLTLITLGVNFHILFYIDIFNFVFETINQNALKTFEPSGQTDTFIIDVKKVNYSEEIVQLFQMMKLIHFKMWKIVQVMNQDFGATLTLLIIQSTNTSIQTFYWIILELYEDDLSKNIRILSMYYQYDK